MTQRQRQPGEKSVCLNNGDSEQRRNSIGGDVYKPGHERRTGNQRTTPTMVYAIATSLGQMRLAKRIRHSPSSPSSKEPGHVLRGG